MSGSLAFLFHQLQQDCLFSDAVIAAQRDGLTEPDPRQDLAGADVARKLAIVAMAAGLPRVVPRPEPLVSPSAATMRLEDFLRALPDSDAAWQARVRLARERGRVLRYLARLDGDGTAAVGICELPANDALAQTHGTDNCVSIHSHAYDREPLIVRGPGAGATVTARALLADLSEALTRFGM